MAKKKQPIYTDYAREQMAVRRITEEEVQFCLNEPEIIRPGQRGTLIFTAHPKGRFIKIVVSGKEPRIVITAAD